jgi:chromatin structure-remodeling complex subunit SFH1
MRRVSRNSHFVFFYTSTFLHPAYMKNLHTWSTTNSTRGNVTPGTRSTRARNTRTSTLAPVPNVYVPPHVYSAPLVPIMPAAIPNPPRPPLPTTPQALQSTYASRLRTGATLLIQPILASAAASTTRAATRRGGVINYADPGSGDDLPDAGALESDDSDFIASGGTRTSIRQSRGGRMGGASGATGGASSPHPTAPLRPEKAELDQSYLGLVPPSKFIKPKLMTPTLHVYP